MELNSVMIKAIESRLKSRGISIDEVDITALWDKSLTYENNISNIESELDLRLTAEQPLEHLKGEVEAFNQEQKLISGESFDQLVLTNMFKVRRVVGLVGNSGVGKSSLALSQILALKRNHPEVSIYVCGVEQNLTNELVKSGINIIYNKEDILDMKFRNSVIYIDEFGDLFSSRSQDKQTERLTRFFNRIDHLNNYVIISSARNGFWNKFICGFVGQYLVKEVDYDCLVNGTNLKRWIRGITSTSDYRLEIPKGDYFVVGKEITEKMNFSYNKSLDSKSENCDLFAERKADKNSEVRL